jgi:predicted nucleotidyltransferase
MSFQWEKIGKVLSWPQPPGGNEYCVPVYRIRIRIMNRNEVRQILHEHNAELAQKYGVRSLALFGSVARDEAGSASDVDLLVEFDRPVGYFGLFALQDHLETLLGCKVDLGTPNSLKPRIRDRVIGECVRVA